MARMAFRIRVREGRENIQDLTQVFEGPKEVIRMIERSAMLQQSLHLSWIRRLESYNDCMGYVSAAEEMSA